MPLTVSGSKFRMYKSPKVWYNRLRNRGSRWSTAGLGRVWQQRQASTFQLLSLSKPCGCSCTHPSLNPTSCKSRPFHSRVRTHTYVISCKSRKKLPFHSRVHVCTKQQLEELQQSSSCLNLNPQRISKSHIPSDSATQSWRWAETQLQLHRLSVTTTRWRYVPYIVRKT